MNVFGATGHLRVNAMITQLFLQARHNGRNALLALRTSSVYRRRDFLVPLRLDIAKAKVLQFPLDLPYSEPIGQWRENV